MAMVVNPWRPLTVEEFCEISSLSSDFYKLYLEEIAREMGRLSAQARIPSHPWTSLEAGN